MSWRIAASRTRALEEEHLVGQAQRVVVEEVDLHLAGADLVDQRVDVELHLLAVVVDVFEQRVELVDRVDRVGLARGLGAAAAADRRLQRHVGVGVARDQVELEFGRDHRVPAFGVVQLADAAQHRARRERAPACRRGRSSRGSPARSGRSPRARCAPCSGRAAGACRGRSG